jgi:protein ImuB
MRALLNLPLFPAQPADREPEGRGKTMPRPARALEPPKTAPLSRVQPRQLWLAIHLPQLALEALQRPSPRPSTPRAVIDPDSRQQIVLACNEVARAIGVRPGQSLNAAIALASHLEALPRDARRERACLMHLAAWCQQQFTPLVSTEPADELLLEVKGSLRLFGGARALMKRIAVGLHEQGITAQLALTPTPRSALWLARGMPSPQPSPASGRGGGVLIGTPEVLARHLAPVSLRHLHWPEELLAQLLGMGLRTVGDLLRLPRGGVVRRFGQVWLDELDRALGRRADVRRGFRSPERFDARCALEYEIETATGLEIACGPLLARLQEFLRQRQVAVATLAVDCKHRAHPLTHLHIGLAAPSGDVGHMRGLLAERLATLVLPAPVIALRMRSGALLEQELAGDGFRNLTPRPASVTDALPRLVERLRARLGNDAVFAVGRVEDHRPEHAWRVIESHAPPPFPASSRERARGQSSPANGRGSRERGKRPLWLLAEPRRIALTPKLLLRGPERIETGWWDGREVKRDYFVARDAHGARLWIYRDRGAPQNWYVHGLFG